MTVKSKFKLHGGEKGSAVTIRVTPRMARNEIHEILEDGTVKIRITAPPVDGKANTELTRFLSEVLEVPASSIEIIAGFTGHDKIVSILGLNSEQVQERILRHLTKKKT